MSSAEPRLALGAASAAGPRYHRLLTLGRPGGWRPVLGVLLLIGLLALVQVAVAVVVSIVLIVGGASAQEAADRLSGDPVTPALLALINLGWALAIPVVWFVVWLLHRMRPGWTASVLGRIRWGWLATCFGIALGALILTLVVSSALPAQGDGSVEFSGELNAWTARTRDFVLVVVLLTPLQAAGEEYVFRGYLAQAFGGLAGRWGERVAMPVAVVVPALAFALAHGLGQDVPIFFDRFAFGLVAGVLTILTGGLEAGIAMHVLNNFLAFGLALALGDMTTALTPTDGTWWSIPVTLTQSLAYLGGCLGVARLSGLADRADRGVLEAGKARV